MRSFRVLTWTQYTVLRAYICKRKGRGSLAEMQKDRLPLTLITLKSEQENEGGPARPKLFRQQALDFQHSGRQWGEVAVLRSVSTKVVAWFIVVVFAAILPFLGLAHYARKETVQGYLTPTSGTAKIFTATSGVITGVYVHEADEVEEGRPLLTIATAQTASDGQDVNVTILNALSIQQDLLRHQIAAEEQRITSERERLTATLRGVATGITQLNEQIITQGERIRLSESLVSSASRLVSQGYLSDLEYKRRQEGVLEQRQSLNALTRQLSGMQNELIETRSKLDQLPTVMAERIQALRGELSTTEQRITEINGRRAYVIRAPIAGRVSTLQATVGQYADPKRLQLEIIPSEGGLKAELFVPTRAAGFVKAGQQVRILYDAFPFQNFGTYRGTVIHVSKTILTGSDSAGPITLKEPAYRATVALERSDIDAHGETIPLQADMLLRADIILERRSLAHWLLNPLLSARRQL